MKKYSKIVKFAKEECISRHEGPGSGYSQLILLDTAVHHKKREVLTSKVCTVKESSKWVIKLGLNEMCYNLIELNEMCYNLIELNELYYNLIELNEMCYNLL